MKRYMFLSWRHSSSANMFSQTPSPSPTPAPPATDIFVVDLMKTSKGGLSWPTGKDFECSYNNQPSFLADGQSVFYTSIKDKQRIFTAMISSAATTQIPKHRKASTHRR